MRNRDEQYQPHVCHRRFPVDEALQRKRENYCRPPTDLLVPHPFSPAEQNQRDQCCRDCGRETRSKIIFAKDTIARDLKPVGERRFIETELIVEIGDDEIAPLAHFPCRFGETWLVAIDQRQTPGACEMEKQAPNKQHDVIAHCRSHD